MEKLTDLWARYGRKERVDVEYLPLPGTPSCRTSDDEPLRSHDAPHPQRSLAFITWQTTPSFEVRVNVYAIWRFLGPMLVALVPSFLRSRKPRKLYPTSYLDGLRGIAALSVVFHHYAINFTVTSMDGWHTGEPGSHDWFFLFPLVRVIHSGRFMVIIFFVISGYVLSLQGLKLARSGDKEKLLDSLTSSVFRRWIRLHIPVIASTFIAFLCARAAVWTLLSPDWDHLNAASHILGRSQPLPYPEGTFMEQFWDWFADAKQLCDPFRYGTYSNSKYNINNLWTIPVEWMGSMLVFATVLGISRCKTWAKVGSLLVLIYWAHHNSRWEWGTFLSGTLLAEISLIRNTHPGPSKFEFIDEKLPEIKAPLQFMSKLFWTILFITGIYLGAQPQSLSSTSPGYMTIMSYLPPQYRGNPDVFWPCIGGVLLVFSLENAPFLQSFFTISFAQYLGDISFSLYMLHGQVLFTLGQWIIPKAMNITGGWENGGFGFGCGLVLSSVVWGPVTFWVSDLFWRGVDRRSVGLARCVGEVCFLKEGGGKVG